MGFFCGPQKWRDKVNKETCGLVGTPGVRNHTKGSYKMLWSVRWELTCEVGEDQPRLCLPFSLTLFLSPVFWTTQWRNEYGCKGTLVWYDKWQGKPKVLWDKFVPVVLCPPRIPRILLVDWTHLSAMRGWVLNCYSYGIACHKITHRDENIRGRGGGRGSWWAYNQ